MRVSSSAMVARITILEALRTSSSPTIDLPASRGASLGSAASARISVSRMVPAVMKMIRSRSGKGLPSFMVKGMVKMMDSVTAPLGPAMVVTRASFRVCLACAVPRWPVSGSLRNSSSTLTHTNRTATTRMVTMQVMPISESGCMDACRVGDMALISCMPRSRKTTALIRNTKMSQKASETMW